MTICVRFDNLPAAPQADFDYTFNLITEPNNPKVELLRGRNTQGSLYQWRIWSKDAQGNPANIGEIKGITAYDFDVKILDDTGGPGASIVQGIDLQPADESSVIHHSNITGGNIATLAGELRLKQEPVFGPPPPFPPPPYVLTGQAGNLHIGTVVTGSVLVIEGGVNRGDLEIDKLESGSITKIGTVYAPYKLTIHDVEGAILHLLNQAEGNWYDPDPPNNPPVINLDVLHSGCVTVSCQYVNCTPAGCDLPPPAEETLLGCCNDGEPNEQQILMTIGRMESGTLHHRGLGVGDTLRIDEMESGTVIIGERLERRLSGLLDLPHGIGGGVVEILAGEDGAGSTSIYPTGVVDLHGAALAGTLQVNASVRGQILNVGALSGTISVGGDLYGAIANVGEVLGTLSVRNVFTGGTIGVGDLLGTLSVNGNIFSGGTIDVNVVGDITCAIDPENCSSAGTLNVVGDVLGAINVNWDIAPGGVLEMNDVSGSLTVDGALDGSLTVTGNMGGNIEVDSHLRGLLDVDGSVSGKVHGHGNLSGSIDVGGNLGSAAEVTIDGNLTRNGKIDVSGESSGLIQVRTMTTAASLVKVGGGLATSNSLIDVNRSGSALSTTRGTIWIGGPIGQNPPVLPFAGAVQVNYNQSPGTFAGEVKIVGCANQPNQPANICVCGTNDGQINQYGNCGADTFSVVCSPGCP